MQQITDFKQLNIDFKSKVLFVMAHPDDECVFTGGLMLMLKNRGIKFDLVCLTNGEASTLRYGLTDGDDLAKVRLEELRKASYILGVNTLIKYGFKDGGLDLEYGELKSSLVKEINDHQIDTVITFEPAGISGHKDHIMTSKALTEIFKEQKNFQLIYVSSSPKYLKEKMQSQPDLRPIFPEFKLKIGLYNALLKIKACKVHFSQFGENRDFWQKHESEELFEYEFFSLAKN